MLPWCFTDPNHHRRHSILETWSWSLHSTIANFFPPRWTNLMLYFGTLTTPLPSLLTATGIRGFLRLESFYLRVWSLIYLLFYRYQTRLRQVWKTRLRYTQKITSSLIKRVYLIKFLSRVGHNAWIIHVCYHWDRRHSLPLQYWDAFSYSFCLWFVDFTELQKLMWTLK